MRKYRIKKYTNGHGTPVYYAQWQLWKLFWFYFKGYDYDSSYTKEYKTIEEANEAINKEVNSDKKYQRKYKETFHCAIIPSHIPKNQIERFLKSKEERND